MKPKKIEIKDKNLQILWGDGTSSSITLKYLRDECPCAGCKGETVLLKTYKPPQNKLLNEDSYNVNNINIVGGYAIQISWKDGHNTGIYSWEYLLELEKGQKDNSKQNYDKLL